MIILFGGSFNPPTIAHFKIADYLIQKYNPSQFIFIPVGNHYHKSDLIDINYRYEMLTLLSKELLNAHVSLYENTEEYKGTYDTLCYFKGLYPNETLYYCIGADHLLSLNRWIHAEDLLKEFKFIVFNRQAIDLKGAISESPFLNRYQSQILVEEFDELDVSSTRYRNLGDDSMVLSNVNDYIYQNHLYYRGGKNEE